MTSPEAYRPKVKRGERYELASTWQGTHAPKGCIRIGGNAGPVRVRRRSRGVADVRWVGNHLARTRPFAKRV